MVGIGDVRIYMLLRMEGVKEGRGRLAALAEIASFSGGTVHAICVVHDYVQS